ncbi:MAG: Ni/Fe hydrogenase subunit alpha [Elusimicrobiales bacterium]|nr:Ni/Fe hydrogenase subunit alpha [Elusimicrobiales bacterium]
MAKNKTVKIKVDYLARVEGEGSLYVETCGGEVKKVRFSIFEPPRLFEAFLRGRHFSEAPDINARICGICPVAYQMSACHAIEKALGVRVDGQLRELRRLFYCGEWLESHLLHMYLLHLPDFLGFEDAIEMGKQHPDAVKRALRMKKAGNAIVSLLGGREIHPINARIGGFYRVPERAELDSIADELKWARDTALESLPFLAKLDYPDVEREYEFVSLSHPAEYPFNEGNVVTNTGLDIPVERFEDNFQEAHLEHSTALYSVSKRFNAGYLTGPLARFNLNYDRLSPLAKQAAQSIGLKPPCKNPFKSLLARGVEVVYAFDEALRIISQYERPAQPSAPVEAREGTGCALTEAPRGSLYHRYSVDEKGLITFAKITPPTSQNQKAIEDDLFAVAKKFIKLPQEKLARKCEQAVRNYDPCISCSTHFLKVKITESC